MCLFWSESNEAGPIWWWKCVKTLSNRSIWCFKHFQMWNLNSPSCPAYLFQSLGKFWHQSDELGLTFSRKCAKTSPNLTIWCFKLFWSKFRIRHIVQRTWFSKWANFDANRMNLGWLTAENVPKHHVFRHFDVSKTRNSKIEELSHRELVKTVRMRGRTP